MNPAEKTLVILIPGFPKDEEDSTAVTFPQLFVKNLKQLNPGLNIIVLAFQYPFFAGQYLWNGVTVHAFNGKNRGKLNRLLVWMSVWKRLKRIMRENHVTGILSFWLGECALMAGWAARKYRIESFTWLLGQDAKLNNRYIRMIQPTGQSLIALSDFLSDELFRNYRIRPAHTIPPGIDCSLFRSSSGVRNIDILGAGSLIPLKQYDQFIRMVAGITRDYPGIRAFICGDGPERKKLEELIRQLGMEKQIILTGELEHKEVLDFMQRTRIFLHPSSYEGFGMVCAEALYAGAHVISYCNPMRIPFSHQHIVKSSAEMESKLRELMATGNLDHASVLTFPIEETCQNLLSLFTAV
jgi:glycosyltransferase involved in cell wall biosynthesis